MDVIIFMALTAASGAYFTSVGCRRAQMRHRRPGWHHALVGTLITALLAVLFICQDDLFRPSRWDRGKVSIWFTVIVASAASGVVALVASSIVVLSFRAKVRDENNAA